MIRDIRKSTVVTNSLTVAITSHLVQKQSIRMLGRNTPATIGHRSGKIRIYRTPAFQVEIMSPECVSTPKQTIRDKFINNSWTASHKCQMQG